MAMLNNQRVIIHNLFIPKCRNPTARQAAPQSWCFFSTRPSTCERFNPWRLDVVGSKKVETMEKNVEESPWKPVKFLAFNWPPNETPAHLPAAQLFFRNALPVRSATSQHSLAGSWVLRALGSNSTWGWPPGPPGPPGAPTFCDKVQQLGLAKIGMGHLIYLILIGTFRPSPSFTILHHSWGAKSWGFHVPTSITMGWSTPPPPQGPPSTPRERPSSRSSRSSRPSRPSRPWVKTVERSRRTKKHSFRVWMMQMILKHFKTIKLHQIRPLSSPLSSNSNPSSNPNDPKNRSWIDVCRSGHHCGFPQPRQQPLHEGGDLLCLGSTVETMGKTEKPWLFPSDPGKAWLLSVFFPSNLV